MIHFVMVIRDANVIVKRDANVQGGFSDTIVQNSHIMLN